LIHQLGTVGEVRHEALFHPAITLRKYPAETLQTDEDFCRAAGEIQGEFLVIHPTREGNARTIKLLTNLLAAQSGRPLLVYDQTAEGTRRYIEAAEAAFKREYAPMVKIIRAALTEGQKSR
jgi:fido (protein-threonine AMPylation protein)